MSLGERWGEGGPVLCCMIYVHIFPSFPHLIEVLHVVLLRASSHCCALLSVISWHGVFWQRNKPPWPMITPTANRYLCMGKAWLGPLIVLTPRLSVDVKNARWHRGLHWFLFAQERKLPFSMQTCVTVGLCACARLSVGSREPYGFWCQAGFYFKLRSPDPPHRAKV